MSRSSGTVSSGSVAFVASAALALTLAGCGGAEASSSRASGGAASAAGAHVPSRQWIVGIDLSASRTHTQLADGQRLLQEVVNALEPGDRLVLIQTYEGSRDDATRWETELPRLREAGRPTGGEKRRIAQARTAALAVVPAFFDTVKMKSIRTTDLMQTLFRAADYAKARPGDATTVLLLSDMLQSTREMDMERPGGIPGREWIARMEREGRLPDLRGVCVYAVGADVETRRGAGAREFWMEYVRAAGGRMPGSAYRGLVTRVGEVGCRG